MSNAKRLPRFAWLLTTRSQASLFVSLSSVIYHGDEDIFYFLGELRLEPVYLIMADFLLVQNAQKNPVYLIMADFLLVHLNHREYSLGMKKPRSAPTLGVVVKAV